LLSDSLKAEPATASIRDAASRGDGSLELIVLDLASLQMFAPARTNCQLMAGASMPSSPTRV
jgi:hypothetical protein